MHRVMIFSGLALVGLTLWAMAHFLATWALVPFAGPDGLYIRLTGVAYALQASTAIFLAANFVWSISGVLVKTPLRRWIEAFCSVAVLLSMALSFFSMGVFRNRFVWLEKILFSSDVYGYYNTVPAANSVVMVLTMWSILWLIARNRVAGYRRRDMLYVVVPSTLSAFLVYLIGPV